VTGRRERQFRSTSAENQAHQDRVFVSTEALMQAIVDGKLSLESASAENLIVLDVEATDAKLLRAALNTADRRGTYRHCGLCGSFTEMLAIWTSMTGANCAHCHEKTLLPGVCSAL
jgi:tRNA threonylcarbamoyladenosine modification (KEOPS) complex  Pcc1 subunit